MPGNSTRARLFDQLILLWMTVRCQTILQKRSKFFNKEEKSSGGRQKKREWTSDDIERLIDELEKRSCLWDIFDKEYHNHEKRGVDYTELEDILKHTKQDLKMKIVGLRTQLGCRIFDRPLHHDVVEIALFIPSSDPLPHLSPSWFFIFIIQDFKSYKNC